MGLNYVIPTPDKIGGFSTGITDDINAAYSSLGLVARALAQLAGQINQADGTAAGNAANIAALQAFMANPVSSPAVPATGLQFLTGGGSITTAKITAAQALGFQGMFLDPRYVWDASGLVLNGVKNFTIESRMVGSIGWGANIAYNTGGYITTSTGSPQDGIQVYASNPSGAPTQGVIFRNCVFVGANSRAVIHFGGGQRRCGLVDCLVYNTSAAAGAYAVVNGSGLSDNNAEDNIFSFTGGGGLAGAYAALGIGVVDQTQRANDTWYYGLATAGGTYSIVHVAGGNQTFVEHYDRSNPATATVWHHGGGRMTFIGGEDQNTTGNSHLIDTSGAQAILINRAVTQAGAQATTISMSNGSLTMRGSCAFNNAQTVAVSGGAVVDLADNAVSAGAATISGSAGTVMLAGNYNPGSAPTLTSWTGPIVYQGVVPVASGRGTAQTTTQTLSFTPQPSGSARVRVSLHLRVTGAGTSTVVSLALTQLGGSAFSQNLPMMKLDGVATAPVLSVTVAGVYTFTGEFDTDASGTAVVLTITPTGSTFTWSGVIERVT